MGYVVTVGLKDGRTFERVVIAGAVITQVGRARSSPFGEREMEWIKATHDKSRCSETCVRAGSAL